MTVHNNEENQFVRELFETNWISSGWLGITNRNLEGRFHSFLSRNRNLKVWKRFNPNARFILIIHEIQT